MNKKQKLIVVMSLLTLAAVLAVAAFYVSGVNVDVLDPAGLIAKQQSGLFWFTVGLSLLVVVPVFTLLAVFAWKYRESNPKEVAYEPNWGDNKWLEIVWWGIPCAIIFVLCIVTWQTSHQLDPRKSIESHKEPLTVQVVALQWKWLFIYPEEKVASLGVVKMPVDRPVNFHITSDAPMNAFWIPSLGSQVYAMSGMSMQLNLVADEIGEYKGRSSNISGEGFADMTFVADAVSEEDFSSWAREGQLMPALTLDSYNKLAEPGVEKEPKTYRLAEENLYRTVVDKYMMPDAKEKPASDSPKEVQQHKMDGMEGLDMHRGGDR